MQRKREGSSSALANTVGHGFIRKVHVLYQRVLRKYPGNVGLWLDFATFCFSHGNARLLSEVTSQGLRLNPSCAGLWCFAANWEYKHKGDISAARHLLLRGLRNCAQSKVLWQVYFRLELKYATDVCARNEVLGVPAATATVSPGAVAEAVFEAARRVHPRDRVFHAQFVYIAAQYGWARELTRSMTRALTRELRESGADADAALYENLLSALGRADAAADAASCGALACGATEDAIARSAAFRADGRATNLVAFTREAFNLDEDARDPKRRKETRAPALDRLGAALRDAGAAALAPASSLAPTALGFDGIHEAEVVTAAAAKAGKKGARVFHGILTGKAEAPGLPLDVLVCRDAAASFEPTQRRAAPAPRPEAAALEDAVFEMMVAAR